MEEIRKQRLVRGIACALWGALDRRGLAVRRCELPRMCYRLSTLHLFRRKPQTVGETVPAETLFRPRPRCGFAPDNMDSTPGQVAARHP